MKAPKPFTWKKPSASMEAETFVQVFWQLNKERTLTQDPVALNAVLKRIDDYLMSYCPKSQRETEEEIHQRVYEAFWTLMRQDSEKGKKYKSEPKTDGVQEG